MADRKITELSAMSAGGQATGDLLTIVDVSEAAAADKNKKITMENLFKGIPGNVGIGTSSANEKLVVSGNASVTGALQITSDTSAPSAAAFLFRPTSNELALGTNSAERIRIDSAGNVGIGTTAPTAKLVVSGDASVTDALQITSNTSAPSAGAFLFRPASNTLALGSNSAERMRIDSSGNVGIGTTSPTNAKLVVSNSTNGVEAIRIDDTRATPSANKRTVDIRYTGTNGRTASNTQLLYLYDNNASSTEPFMEVENASNSLFTIDSSGRLLVGTSSDVTGSTSHLIQAVNSIGGRITLARNDTSVTDGQTIGQISFSGNDLNGTYQQVANITCEADGTHGDNDKPGRLRFMVTADGAGSATERVRISENGRFSAYADSDTVFAVRNAGTAAASAAFAVYNNSTSVTTGTVKCVIRQDGDLENTNNSYGALSDVKLKENIVDAASQWDDLKAIQVRKYNFKEETGHETYTQIGVIAQEIETVSPGLVSESPDLDDEGNDLGTVTKSVNYSVLYMKAVKALQEAMDRIETLEAKVAALEAQ